MDLDELLDILALRPVGGPATEGGPAGRPVFEGRSPRGRSRSIFGGQFLAQ
jgi:hypothetical protein